MYLTLKLPYPETVVVELGGLQACLDPWKHLWSHLEKICLPRELVRN